MTESKVSELEQQVRPLQDAFLSGDKAAADKVWALVIPTMCRRASEQGFGYTEAKDIAVDAMMYVQGRGASNFKSGTSLMALLNRAVDWHASKAKHEHNRDGLIILSSDLESTMEDTYTGDEDDDEGSSPLEQLEALRIQEGWDPSVYVGAFGQYMSSIVTETPEDLVAGQNMRTRLESMAVEACGQKAWDIYYAVVVNEDSQSEVAERLGVSQPTVSRTVSEVGAALKAALLGT